MTGIGGNVSLGPPRAQERIFIAVPTSEHIHKYALPGLCAPSRSPNRAWVVRPYGHSMLNKTFNDLLCMALNERKTHGWRYFVMHHADQESEIGWLDKLMDEYHRSGADVLSVVIAIKDRRGVVSTGLRGADGRITPFTVREVLDSLPSDTFGIEDVPHADGDHLVVNSGLMVFDLTASWVERWALDEAFCSVDKVFKDPVTGKFSASCLTEDWSFSAYCHLHGIRCKATKVVKVTHHGSAGFTNFERWGDRDRDEGRR